MKRTAEIERVSGNPKTPIVPAGRLVVLTIGEYSSHAILGVFRALKEINTAEAFDSYKAEYPLSPSKSTWATGPLQFVDHNHLAAFLVRRGDLEEIHAFEWRLPERYGGA
jgi:hypothetical protein